MKGADFLRECILSLFSLLCWVFCIMAIITVLSSFFGVNLYYVQLIRTLMNIEESTIQNIFGEINVFALFVIVYLLFAGLFNRLKLKTTQERGDSQ